MEGKNGLLVQADQLVEQVDPAEADALAIPGGWAPDKPRRYPAITELVRAINDAGKPIGIICHAGLVAIDARIVGEDRSAPVRSESATTS